MSKAPKYQGFVPGRQLLDAYGNGGFRFGEMSHRGSILMLPSGVHAWPVAHIDQLTLASLQPLFDEPHGAVDLLLLGVGAEIQFVRELFRQKLRDLRIGLEVMQTGAAARTYNILAQENRKVAAALIAVE